MNAILDMDAAAGILPPGWAMTTIAEAVRIAEGQVDPRVEPFASMVHVGPENVEPGTGRLLSHATAAELGLISGKYRFKRGDVVYSKIRPYLRKVWLASLDGLCSADMYPLSVKEGFDASFVSLFLLSKMFTRQATASQARTGIPKVNREQLKSCQIPRPPLREQRAIAAVLRRFQELITQEDRRIAALADLECALISKVFDLGLTSLNTKITSIGRVPDDWKVAELKDLLREPLRNGHSAPALSSGEGVRTLTLTAVTKREFTISNTKLTSAEPGRIADLWLKDGDIFVERANTYEMVGLAALYRGASDFAIFPDLLVRVRVDERQILPEVLTAWLRTPIVRAYFQKHCSGAATSMPKIEQGTIERTIVPVPPMNQQEYLRRLFVAIDARIDRAIARHRCLQELFSTCLDRLVTGQLRMTPSLEGQLLTSHA